MTEVIQRSSLAHVGRGFKDPVHGAQQVFRAVLEAMSRPGRVQRLPAVALDGLESPFGAGLGALLLTLLDGETGVWIDPAIDSRAARAWLQFHTGVRRIADPADAPFAVVPAEQAHARLWSTLPCGSDEVPQAGATLIVEVPSLTENGAGAQRLQGPGIAGTQTLCAGGLDAAFWQARAARRSGFPRGIDLILVCGDLLAAVPRSTRIVEA